MVKETIQKFHELVQELGENEAYTATIWHIVEDNKGNHAVIGELVETVQNEYEKIRINI